MKHYKLYRITNWSLPITKKLPGVPRMLGDLTGAGNKLCTLVKSGCSSELIIIFWLVFLYNENL